MEGGWVRRASCCMRKSPYERVLRELAFPSYLAEEMVGSVRAQSSLDPDWLALWSWPPVFGILGNMCMLFPSHGFVTQQCPEWTEKVSSLSFLWVILPSGHYLLRAPPTECETVRKLTSSTLLRFLSKEGAWCPECGPLACWNWHPALLPAVFSNVLAPFLSRCARGTTTFSLLCLLGSLNSCGLEGVRFIVLLKPQNQFRVQTRRWRQRCVLRLRSQDAFFPLIWQTYVPP